MRTITTAIVILLTHLAAQAQEIASAMDSLLRDDLFKSSDVSVVIYDLDDDKSIYSHRADKKDV